MVAHNVAFCAGCGQAIGRCDERPCGRRHVVRFCEQCGRRLREIVIVPGQTALACPHHGPRPA